MKPDEKPTTAEREQTDERIRLERVKSDDVIAETLPRSSRPPTP